MCESLTGSLYRYMPKIDNAFTCFWFILPTIIFFFLIYSTRCHYSIIRLSRHCLFIALVFGIFTVSNILPWNNCIVGINGLCIDETSFKTLYFQDKSQFIQMITVFKMLITRTSKLLISDKTITCLTDFSWFYVNRNKSIANVKKTILRDRLIKRKTDSFFTGTWFYWK